MTGTVEDLGLVERTPRRHRIWPWLVALVLVAGLVVAAWFIGERIARQVVTDTVREQVVTQLALPDDQEVDVELGGGALIPQLIAGTLDVVTVASDDVPLGPTTGDVTVRAAGVPIRGEPVVDAAQGTVTLTVDEVSALLAENPDLVLEDVRFTGTDVAVTAPLSFLGIEFPIGATLSPRADGGDLVLSPVSYTVAGAAFSAADLRDRFGSLVDTVTSDRTICLRGYLPAGVALQHVAVDGDVIRAQFSVDPRIAADPALQENGTCG